MAMPCEACTGVCRCVCVCLRKKTEKLLIGIRRRSNLIGITDALKLKPAGYSASYRETWPAAIYNHQKWQLVGKSQWYCSANAAIRCTLWRTIGSAAAAASEHTTAPINHTRPSPQAFTRWRHQSGHPIAAYYSLVLLWTQTMIRFISDI